MRYFSESWRLCGLQRTGEKGVFFREVLLTVALVAGLLSELLGELLQREKDNRTAAIERPGGFSGALHVFAGTK